MKKLLPLFFLLAIGHCSIAKTTTSIADGPANTNVWSNPAYWDNGIPAAGDNVIINHYIYVASLSNTGTITINSTGELHVGSMANNGTIVMNDGKLNAPVTANFGAINGSGDFNCSGSFFSPGTINGETVSTCAEAINALPVTYAYFNLKTYSQSILLEWATTFEENNDHFIIERSNNGMDWSNIGLVEGAINATTGAHYSFKDQSPISGVQYYRLKQMDLDGKSSYSTVISAYFIPTAPYYLYPNAIQKDAVFHIKSANQVIEHIGIYSPQGNLLVSVNPSDKTEIEVSTAGLKSGLHIVKIQIEGKAYAERIIIQ